MMYVIKSQMQGFCGCVCVRLRRMYTPFSSPHGSARATKTVKNTATSLYDTATSRLPSYYVTACESAKPMYC